MQTKIHLAEMKETHSITNKYKFLNNSLINSNAGPKIEKYKWESDVSHHKASGEKRQNVVEEFHF